MLGCYILSKFVLFASLRENLHESREFSWGGSWVETFKNNVELRNKIQIKINIVNDEIEIVCNNSRDDLE